MRAELGQTHESAHLKAVGDVEKKVRVSARVVQHLVRQRPHSPVGQLQALVRLHKA